MSRVIIIAEAGVNHNGDISLAKKLINVASDAGADYVKFQTFMAEKLVSKTAKKAAYQNKNIKDNDDSQYNMLKKLELSEAKHKELISYSIKKGIKFLSSGFDDESIDFLDELGIDFFKIPSGEITNKPYLKHIARKGKPIVMSTGMADLNEIRDALNILTKEELSLDKITVLHCNTEYPTPMKDVNLLAMKTIEKTFGVKVGYSDHTLGIEIPIAAVAMGATVIEKHFTLDRNMEGPDHKASLEPGELKEMVKCIRNIEISMGDGIKNPSDSEIKNKSIVRKSIHLKINVPKHTIITEDMLIMKRPGDGISPMEIDKLISRKANKNLCAEHKLKWSDLI